MREGRSTNSDLVLKVVARAYATLISQHDSFVPVEAAGVVVPLSYELFQGHEARDFDVLCAALGVGATIDKKDLVEIILLRGEEVDTNRLLE